MNVEDYGWHFRSGKEFIPLDDKLTFEDLLCNENRNELCLYLKGEEITTVDVCLHKDNSAMVYVSLYRYGVEASNNMSFHKDLSVSDNIMEMLRELSLDIKEVYDSEIQDLIYERDKILKTFQGL